MLTKQAAVITAGTLGDRRLNRGLRCLGRWWVLGLRGLGSFAATEVGTPPRGVCGSFPVLLELLNIGPCARWAPCWG